MGQRIVSDPPSALGGELLAALPPSWTGSVTLGEREITLETGRVARQADGAVLIRSGETVLLVTVVAANAPREGVDFFPLTVEYRERFSAVGRFPGGYRKREGRASDQNILTCRLVDRSIRPLFPDGYRCEVQVIATVLSYDPEADPESLAILGTAAALHLSTVPFDGPIAGFRMGQDADGKLIVLPTAAQLADSGLDLMLSLGGGGLVMAEGEAREVADTVISDAIDLAAETAKPFFDLLEEGRKHLGIEARPFESPTQDAKIVQAVADEAGAPLKDAVLTSGKHERSAAKKEVATAAKARLAERFPDRESEISEAIHDLEKKTLRQLALEDGKRVDGRGPKDIRPLWIEHGVLPRVHGSALFTRGETQAMVVTTLGSARDQQEVETLDGVESHWFQLYYTFPPYSVGEARPMRGPGRREIGHGNLALRALKGVLPTQKDFPYTIKVESEITESNGSSSMASVCGGCLALMDAGVPLRSPVAGIAMGLISDGEKTVVLSDILGDEDHLGDMDFKVAGTKDGITAIQLDNKLGSLPASVLKQALEQGREGYLHILGAMTEVLAEPTGLAPSAPRISMMTIGTHRIRTLIGSGGKTIRELQSETGTTLDVAENGDVRIFAPDLEAIQAAEKRVRDLTGEPEVGKFYRGPVTGIASFGAFVRLFEGIEGMIHVSQLADRRVDTVESVVSDGQIVNVKVIGTEKGRIQLSLKDAVGVDESDIANL